MLMLYHTYTILINILIPNTNLSKPPVHPSRVLDIDTILRICLMDYLV